MFMEFRGRVVLYGATRFLFFLPANLLAVSHVYNSGSFYADPVVIFQQAVVL